MTFARHGFMVVDNVFSPHQWVLASKLVARLIERHRAGDQAVVAESVSLASLTRQHPQRNPGIHSDEVEGEPYIIGNLMSLDARFAKIFSDGQGCASVARGPLLRILRSRHLSIRGRRRMPGATGGALWAWAGELLGCAPREVVFHFSNVTRKPAFKGPAVSWHRDAENTYFACADGRTLRFLLPLQPMSKINGGTEIIMGSHLPEALASASGILNTSLRSPVTLAHPCAAQTVEGGGVVCCPSVAPGSALVLHSGVLHGGGINRSPSDRDVIVIQFGVASSVLRYQAHEKLSLSRREAFLSFDGNTQANFYSDGALSPLGDPKDYHLPNDTSRYS